MQALATEARLMRVASGELRPAAVRYGGAAVLAAFTLGLPASALAAGASPDPSPAAGPDPYVAPAPPRHVSQPASLPPPVVTVVHTETVVRRSHRQHRAAARHVRRPAPSSGPHTVRLGLDHRPPRFAPAVVGSRTAVPVALAAALVGLVLLSGVFVRRLAREVLA